MAFAFDKAEFVLIFPEFSALPEPQILAFEEIAKLYCTEGIFASRAQYALMLLTAHLLELNVIRRGNKAGALESEKVGDLSRTFAKPESIKINSTNYGEQFRQLQNALGLNFLYVGGAD